MAPLPVAVGEDTGRWVPSEDEGGCWAASELAKLASSEASLGLSMSSHNVQSLRSAFADPIQVLVYKQAAGMVEAKRSLDTRLSDNFTLF